MNKEKYYIHKSGQCIATFFAIAIVFLVFISVRYGCQGPYLFNFFAASIGLLVFSLICFFCQKYKNGINPFIFIAILIMGVAIYCSVLMLLTEYPLSHC